MYSGAEPEALRIAIRIAFVQARPGAKMGAWELGHAV